MDLLKNLFSSGAKEVIGSVGGVIDGLTTSQEEKIAAKQAITEKVTDSMTEMFVAQTNVLKTEMSGNWLQRSWRPLVMITFTLLLVIRWTGLATHEISEQLELKLMEIIELGLGGYVVGRSMEKIAKNFSNSVDLSSLKKKDKKDILKNSL